MKRGKEMKEKEGWNKREILRENGIQATNFNSKHSSIPLASFAECMLVIFDAFSEFLRWKTMLSQMKRKKEKKKKMKNGLREKLCTSIGPLRPTNKR